MPRPICLRLLSQLMRRADSRACCTAGRSNGTSTPMMAMTTRSSTRVKPRASVKPRVRRLPKKRVMSHSDHKLERTIESGNHFGHIFGRSLNYEDLPEESHPRNQEFLAFHLDGRRRTQWWDRH